MARPNELRRNDSGAIMSRAGNLITDGFNWPVRVYYEDTDAAGIVYHANYLRFMERARTEWLRALGFEQDTLRREHRVVFVITRSDVEYCRAARFNDELTVVSVLNRQRKASFEFAQRIDDLEGNTVCRALNTVACVEPETLAVRRIPDQMMKVLKGAS